MSGAKHLQAAALLVGLLLLCFTVVDWLGLVWPLQPREVEWRYGALSALSGSLLTPLLAMLVLFGAAVLGERRGLQRVLSVLLLVGGLGLGAACALLALDVVQVRAGLRPEILPRFDVTAGRSLLKLALGSLAALAFGLVAHRACRATGPDGRRKHRRRDDAEGPFLMHPSAIASESTGVPRAREGASTS